MRTSGARYRQPEANPLGRPPAGHGTAPSSASQSGGFRAAPGALAGAAPRSASTPVAIRTPVAGSAANSRSLARVTRAHWAVRGLSSTRCGPQIAPATEEVVSAGGAAARMVTRSPASARHTAVVSPETPVPTTRTSQSLLGTALTVPAPPALPTAKTRRAAGYPVLR